MHIKFLQQDHINMLGIFPKLYNKFITYIFHLVMKYELPNDIYFNMMKT